MTAAVVVALLAKPIMTAYGESFRAGWMALVVLVLAAIAEVLNLVLGQPLIATHRMWWRFGFDALLVAVLLSAAWVLIPKWRALGFATAYGLAFALTSVGLAVFMHTWPTYRSRVNGLRCESKRL